MRPQVSFGIIFKYLYHLLGKLQSGHVAFKKKVKIAAEEQDILDSF